VIDLAAFMAQESLPPEFAQAVATIHMPLAKMIAERREALGRPILVGLAGPQGSGKSTAAAVIAGLLAAEGLKVAVLSIDDFYLSHDVRRRMAEDLHPLLGVRGPPGTHDLSLTATTINLLLSGDAVALPSFDKAVDDRRPRELWPMFSGPADVVLLEGWCVGARAQGAEALVAPINALERDEDADGAWRRFTNAALDGYQPLFDRFDLLIQLLPQAFEDVVRWRQEQEAKLRARTAGQADTRTMTDDQVARFVQHYERITRWMMEEMPVRVDAVVELGAERELKRSAVR